MPDYGSLNNDLYARGTIGQPEPEVGMGATVLAWTDRHAATITAVTPQKSGGWIISIREDEAKVVKGSTFDGSAVYECSPNPKGRLSFWRAKDKDARWHQVVLNTKTNRWIKAGNSNGLTIGRRDHYRDPHF